MNYNKLPNNSRPKKEFTKERNYISNLLKMTIQGLICKENGKVYIRMKVDNIKSEVHNT